MADDPILSALARLEQGQAALRTDVLAELGKARAELGSELDKTRAEFRDEVGKTRIEFLAELGKTRVQIMEKVGEVQASITSVRDDILVNMGGVDKARKANDNIRADMIQMHEQMSIMWKQIKTLEARVRGLTGEP